MQLFIKAKAALDRMPCRKTSTATTVHRLVVVCLGAFIIPAVQAGAIFTNLHSFTGGLDGSGPLAGLVQGSDSNFYGTTYSGGSFNKGVVFKITQNGIFTNLISFDGTNGAGPQAALFPASDGNFYGTTQGGGQSGAGTVFRISTAGVFTNIAYFYAYNGGPSSALVEDDQGNLYGTTPTGGESPPAGNGTVFKVSTNGAISTLVVFSADNGDGRGPGPQSGLIHGGDGNFYGTSMYGGTNGLPLVAFEDGMLFQMTPGGVVNVVASFNGVNGAFPVGGLIQGRDGSFYGTTEGGGTNSWGAVFQVTTNGTIYSLFSFTGGSDGGNPQAGLIQDCHGVLYGTTLQGGTNGNGVIFQITTNGTFTTLYTFSGGEDGGYPVAGLFQAKDGSFYGTAQHGGQYGNGAVYRLTITPSPPVLLSIFQQTGAMVLTWNSAAGQSYQVQCNSNLSSTNWNNIGNPVTANGGTLSVTNAVTNSQQYYRVSLLL